MQLDNELLNEALAELLLMYEQCKEAIEHQVRKDLKLKKKESHLVEAVLHANAIEGHVMAVGLKVATFTIASTENNEELYYEITYCTFPRND